MPESSASASSPVAEAAARALPRALSAYEASPSGGSSTPGKSARLRMRNGRPARRSAISLALARLAVARTSAGSEVEGRLAARLEGAPLKPDQPPDAGFRQREHLGEPIAAEGRLLRRSLHLDEGAGAGHDHVHVDLGRRVLDVVEVEHRRAADDAHADGRHAVTHRRARHRARFDDRADGVGHGDEAACDGRRARAAVGLDDVAVDPDRALAELGHLDDGAERAADQALDLLRPAAGPAPLAAHARVRRARQHAVLRRHPALALPLEEGRHLLLDRGGADDLRVAELDQDRALGVAEVVAGHAHGPEVLGPAAVEAEAHRAVSLLAGRLCTVRTRWS